jgi:hypothetical protein
MDKHQKVSTRCKGAQVDSAGIARNNYLNQI